MAVKNRLIRRQIVRLVLLIGLAAGALTISHRYQRTPIYHALLEQDNVHLPSVASRSASAWTARAVMEPADPIVAPESSIQDAWERLQASGRSAILAGAPERLDSIIPADSLRAAVESGRAAEPVGSLIELDFSHVHVDHGLDVVFERFGDSPGLLPVVDRADTRRVEGVITLADIRRFTKKRGRDGAA